MSERVLLTVLNGITHVSMSGTRRKCIRHRSLANSRGPIFFRLGHECASMETRCVGRELDGFQYITFSSTTAMFGLLLLYEP